VDKVIVKYSGRVIFRQYIPKKRKRFGIKIYKSVWLEDQVQQQQILCGSTTAITNTGSEIHATPLPPLFISRSEKDHGLQVRQV